MKNEVSILKLYANKIGGTENAVYKLEKILRDDFDVKVYSAFNYGEIDNLFHEKILVGHIEEYRTNKIKSLLKYFFRLKTFFRGDGCVVSTDMATACMLITLSLAYKSTKIFVWEHYPYEKNSLFWRSVFRFLVKIKKDFCIICNSDNERRKFNFFENVFIIPNAIEVSKSKKIIHQEKDFLRLLYVGRVVKDKGVERLLDLLLSNDGVHSIPYKYIVDIVGDGDELERLRLKYILLKNICFHGATSNVGEFYNKADIFVSGSFFECLPISVLEAMSYGIPIISLDNSGGTKSAIVNEQMGLTCGFICKDYNDFFQAMNYYRSFINRAVHGDNGFDIVSCFYSEELIKDKWQSIL